VYWESQQKAKVFLIIQAGGLESGAPDQHRVQAGERQAEGAVETPLDMVAGGAKDPVTASDAFWKMIDAWPELAAIRRAASANSPSQYRLEVEAMLRTARVAFAASLIAWTTPDQGVRSPAVRDAQRMHDTLRAAVAVHRAELQARWYLSDD
jgi:hypothetical protein